MRKFFTLAALCLAAMCANAQDEAGYTIRTLTFEDADFKGDNPTFGGETNWSSLIDDPQYGGPMLYGSGAGVSSEEEAYKWTDENNTWLSNTLSEGYGTWCYWSGGHAISNYASADIETYGDFNSQLTITRRAMTWSLCAQVADTTVLTTSPFISAMPTTQVSALPRLLFLH